jgi:hypothetical protein
MPNNFEITCPKCKANFNAEEAFKEHFEKEKEREIAKIKNEEIKKAQLEAAKKYETKIEKYEEEKLKRIKELEKVKSEEKQKAQLEADKKLKNYVEQLNKEKIKLQKEAEKSARDKAEKDKELFIKSFKEEEQKKIEKKIRDDAELKSKKETLNKDKLIQELKDQVEKINKERSIETERNKKQIEELVSLNAKTKSEIKGEVQEELIHDYLKARFPEDHIQEVKKGARGPDCILTINYKGKKNIGKIYIESKDTKIWNEEWVTKLFNDMQTQGASNGIIISTSVPKDFDEKSGFVNREANSITIIKMDYGIIHVTVSLIKSLLIMKDRNANSSNLPEEVKKVWENVKSPNFQMPIRSIVNQIREFQKIFKKESKDFHNSSSNKERTLKQLDNDLVRMIASFTKTAGEIFPPDLLEHKDDNLLE